MQTLSLLRFARRLFSGLCPLALVLAVVPVSASAGALWWLGGSWLFSPRTADFGSAPQLLAAGALDAAGGDEHTLVLKRDGTLWVMGRNNHGQLGDGTETDRAQPRQIASGVTAIAAARAQSFFIKGDATLWASGFNAFGNLGDGTTTDRLLPIQVAANVAKVSAGRNHTLFLKTDGTLWGMGLNNYGALGAGAEELRPTPIQIATNVVACAAGESHSVFLKTDGTAWALGNNRYHQFSPNGTIFDSPPVLQPLQIAGNVTAIEAYGDCTRTLSRDGTLRLIGTYSRPTVPEPNDPVILGWPAQPSAQLGDWLTLATDVVEFFGNGMNTHYRRTDGTTWQHDWILPAFNSYALPKLGTPTLVTPDVRRVSHGRDTTFFLRPDNTLWAQGSTSYGQLGVPAEEARLPWLLDRGVTAASVGYNQTFWLRNDRTLWAAGANTAGLLDADTTDWFISTPVRLATDVAQLSSGESHTLFVTSNGALWGLGANEQHQLSPAADGFVRKPTQIATGVAAASAGETHTVFIKTDGTLWGVGSNGQGELGDGSTTSRSTPVQIATGVAQASAGSGTTFFIRPDGTLWGCGANDYGQLGLGAISEARKTPVQIATGVAQIDTSSFGLLFVKTDGTLWACGRNTDGQLGDGTTEDRATPVKIATGVRRAIPSDDYSLFIKTDGSLWCMGRQLDYELGASVASSSIPIQLATNIDSAAAHGLHAVVIQAETAASAPVLREQPASTKLAVGGTVDLHGDVTSFAGPAAYAWFKDGVRLSGETSPALLRLGASADDAGEYQLVVTNSAGDTRSAVARVAVMRELPAPVAGGKLTGLSARVLLRDNGTPVVAGVGVAGGPLRLLVRASGPALRDFGITNVLGKPELRAFRAETAFALNSGWQTSPDAAALPALFTQLGEFQFAPDSKDCALLLTLDPGAYTFQVTSSDNAPGVTLVEAYVVPTTGLAGRLTALSCRAYSGPGDAVLTAGFATEGQTQVLMRGLGPRLAGYGVTGALTAPVLTLYDGTAVRDHVWEWGGFYPFAPTTALFGRVGLGTLPGASLDTVCIATVASGVRSVQIAGTSGESGEALAEVYLVQP